ncbi:hypothetical protein BH09BAC6_BH09BAC6_30940 [soil metagenome]
MIQLSWQIPGAGHKPAAICIINYYELIKVYFSKQQHTDQNGPVHSPGCKVPFFQPKLTINQPNDVYEQEADHMADKVMRMADPAAVQPGFFKPATNAVQRKCQACEEEEKHVHRKESNSAEVHSNELGNYVNSLGSSGQAMPESSRKFFEPRFGHDFSNVRLHTDSVAAKSAQSINALAYTTGNNIVFNSGQYSPESHSGKRLMAHELTHVVQQNSGVSPKLIQRSLIVNPADSVPPARGVAGPRVWLTVVVERLLNEMCPSGRFHIDPGTGVVFTGEGFCDRYLPGRTGARRLPTEVSCRCLCDVIYNPQIALIRFLNRDPVTTPSNALNASNGVGTYSTTQIDPTYHAQYFVNGSWVDVPFYLLFAHELCGHGLSNMRGTQVPNGPMVPGGMPARERQAVDVERNIAAEHGLPRRPDDYGGGTRGSF